MGGESQAGQWRPDPRGKYDKRWFDGTAWTAQVSDGGQSAVDPFFRPEDFTPEALAAVATSKGGGSKKAVAVVAVLVLVAAAVLVGVLLSGGDDAEVATDDTSTTSTTEEATTTTAEATTTTEEATTTTTEPELEDPSEVVGSNVATAVGQLEDAGFVVTEAETIDESVPDGQVVAAEEQADGSVIVTVARGPVTRFLENVSPVDSQGPTFRDPPFDISGQTFSHGVVLTSCQNDTFFVEYDLGRDFRRFQAIGGLTDNMPADMRLRLEISLDGAILSTNDLGLGETVSIDVDVSGALRLRLAVTVLEDETSCGFGRNDFGFGDGRLLGVPSEVPPETGD